MGNNTTTTTTPKKKNGGASSALNQAKQAIIAANQSPFGSLVGGAGGSSNINPGVTSTASGDPVEFAPSSNPNPLGIPANVLNGLVTANAKGDSTTTYNSAVTLLKQLQGNRALMTQIQLDLRSVGLLKTTTHFSPGTLDSVTQTAWEQLLKDSINSKLPVTTLLGLNSPTTYSTYVGYASQLASAQATQERQAAQLTNANVTLTDPNEVAQKYATAMESIGLGAPTQEATNAFVNAFINGPQGEIAATQNQVAAEKQNYMHGVNYAQTALNDLGNSNLAGAEQAALSTNPGPVATATKAAPNLDAESMAAAKAANPGMYAATGTTYLYGLLQRMLAGGLQEPTSPTSPSSQAPGGAIVTTPIAGAG